MKYFGTILLFIVVLFVTEFEAQTKIICNGKKIVLNNKTTFVSNRNIRNEPALNEKAIYLPIPEFPPVTAEFRVSGVVNIQTTINENGDVISAKAISGNPLIRNLAVEAVWKAKFKKKIINCHPQKYTGLVIYNFSEENYQKKIADEEITPLIGDFEKEFAKDLTKKWNIKTDSFEILNGKGISFARPTCPSDVKNCSGFVKVLVLLDENKKVIEVEPISGDSRLFDAAVSAIRQPIYVQPSSEQTKTIGFYVYNFDFAKAIARQNINIFNGGVANGRATYLPKPVLPPDVNITGSVNIKVTIDEEGNVISAEPLSGDDILKTFALKSAWKAKFKPTFLSGKPVKVNNAVIFYNFPPKQIQ